MLDNSGSMRTNDPENLINVAVRAFLDRLQGDQHVAIIAFDKRASMLMPLSPLNDESRPRFLSSLDAIDYAGQLTDSPAALERALYELRESSRPGAERSIVFMTDGIVDVAPEGPDPGDVEKGRWMKSTLADLAAESAVRIFGIAFTDGADFELIQMLAKRTGGEYYRAYTPTDMDAVFDSIHERLTRPSPVQALANAGAMGTPTPAAIKGVETAPPATVAALPQPSVPPIELSPVPAPQMVPPAVELPTSAELASREETSARPSGSVADPASTAGGIRANVLAQPPDTRAVAGAGDDASAESGDSTPATDEPDFTAASSGRTLSENSSRTLGFALVAAALLLAVAALVLALRRRRSNAVTEERHSLMPTAYLNDIGGVSGQVSYPLNDKPVIVGRLRGPESAPAAYVVIDESTIGRRHALIEYKDHSFWATDQKSLNGTFVNNVRIESPTRLKHGDRIRFHKHEFEFLVLDMFETDHTMMSETMFAELARRALDDDQRAARIPGQAVVGEQRKPITRDPNVTRH